MAGDGELLVTLQALSKYSMDMQMSAVHAATPISSKLAIVEADSSGAFSGLSGFQAGVFAEGPVMQAAMAKQSYAFDAFVADLTRGLLAIGNAASVCAFAYKGTDIETAEKMNLLGYAFATDPDAKAPAGMPKEISGETLIDQEMAAQSVVQPEALTNPSGGTTAQIFNGGTITTYSDGSSTLVQTRPDPNAPNGAVSVTTVMGAGGTVLNTTTTRTTYSANGVASESYRQVVTPGGEIKASDGKTYKTGDTTVTTENTRRDDGGRTITTTTTHGDQKPIVSTVEVDPPKVKTKTDVEVGPLQEAQEVLGPDAGKVDWRKGYQGVQAPATG